MKRYGGILALSPMFVLAFLFLGLGILWGDFYRVPMLVVFLITAAYAICTTRGENLEERIRIFSRGAGSSNLMLMLWIFILAGAFANSAKAMGAIDATVGLTLSVLPTEMFYAGLFLAACLVSISIGTSVGTIVALVPIANAMPFSGYAHTMLIGAVVGGAFFGDNLSFISDTTVVATRTQEVKMSDKFRANFRIVLPAAIICIIAYTLIGFYATDGTTTEAFTSAHTTSFGKGFILTLPYWAVLLLAICGMNVLGALFIGNALTGIIGICTGAFDLSGWMQSMAQGVYAMTEVSFVALLAGGIMELIRYNGGIDFIIRHLTARINGKRGAEACIAFLVSVVNCCTANNTVAILATGHIAAEIADRYEVDRRKSASLLDTFSCVVQGILPYGAQLLMAAGLTMLTPFEIIPALFYPLLLFFAASSAIIFRFPRKFS